MSVKSKLCILFVIFLSIWISRVESKSLVNIGVILDMNSQLGEMANFCISTAVSDFYNLHPNYATRLVLHTKDSQEDVVGAAFAALDLLKNAEVQAIIGPVRSTETEFVVELGGKAHVPIISFSATSPALSPIQNPYFVRAAQDDTAQVKAITAIVQGFGWREVVLIYEDTEYGSEICPYLTDAFLEVDIRVSYKIGIPAFANDTYISRELYKLKKTRIAVFLVHMSISLGSRLFLQANDAGMISEGYAWVITDALSVSLDSMDSKVIDSMEGVLGIRPNVPRSKDLENFKTRWKRFFPQTNPKSTISELNIFGLWAYDAAWALAMAMERIAPLNSSFVNAEQKNSMELPNLGTSQIGPKLRKEILRTRFRGLSGPFHLVDGEFKPSALEIFNIIGDGERIVGYWTPEKGISRHLDFPIGNVSYSTSTNELKKIIWPGDSTVPPIGWAIPIINKLKIGVPVKQGFNEFVKIEDTPTGEINITGLSIDVFHAVLRALPFNVHCELIPFKKENGDSSGTYDQLIFQVYNKTFDAAVGDITIVANRSSFVDFTLSYSESGVSMVVPITHGKPKSMWIFLRPLTWDLWLTIVATWLVTGASVWAIERRVQTLQRSSSQTEVCMIFWLPFLSLVLPQRETIDNKWSKLVIVLWIALACILMQSYTASLSSLLTVELQSAITDVSDLVKKGSYVGYQHRSFVRDLLIEQLKFDESRLISYSTVEDYHAALSNGSVVAIFDEIPYLKIFLSKYCSKYKMVGPTYRMAGFGYAFQRGSPLVPYFSRAILNVTEGRQMDKIESRYFKSKSYCQEQATTTSANTPSLSAHSFGGLFMIVNMAILIALIASKISSFIELVTRLKHHGQNYVTRLHTLLGVQPGGNTNATTNTTLAQGNHPMNAENNSCQNAEVACRQSVGPVAPNKAVVTGSSDDK